MRDPLHFLPIRVKLPLAFLAIGLLVLGPGAVLFLKAAGETTTDQIERLLAERTETAADFVVRELEALARRAEDFASDGYLRQQLVARTAGDEAAGARIRRHFETNKLPLVPAFVAASVAGPEEAAPDRGVEFSDLTADPAGRTLFSVSTPVRRIDEAEPIGRLELTIDAETWRARLAPLPFRAEEGFSARLCSASGVELSLAAGGEPGPDRLTSMRTVAGAPFRLEVVADRGAAMAPLNALVRRFQWIGAALIAAMALVAFFPVHFILRPLATLRQATRRVGAGDLDVRLPADGRDEIGELAAAFNDMTAALSERNRQLAEASARLNGVIRALQDGLLILDRSGEVTLSNAAAAPLVRTFSGQVTPKGLACDREHQGPEACAACLADVRRSRHLCTMEIEGRAMEILATTLPGRDGEPAGRIFLSRDVTDRLAEAARQAHQERLAVLGEITAVVAHELSNPLASISMFGQMLLDELPADSPHREHAEVIVRNADVGRKTIRGLLDMASAPTAESERFDVHEVLFDALRLLAPISRRAGATTELKADARESKIIGDELQIRQAVVNLVMNAIQAAEGPGARVEITTFDDGSRLGIRVTDDGPGIPATVRARIFDPFFTTKPPGFGTGLGLPTARRIAEAHGGTLELARTGRGRTEFVLLLPRERTARPIPMLRPPEVRRGG